MENYLTVLESALKSIDVTIPIKNYDSKGVFNNKCSETIQKIDFFRKSFNNESQLKNELNRVIKENSLGPPKLDYPPEIISSSLQDH